MKKKIFFIQDIIPNYRIPLFERLAAYPDFDVTVFYSRPSRKMASEHLRNATGPKSFKHVKLPLLEVGHTYYQPTFLSYIARKRPDVVVAGAAGRLDMLLAQWLCRITGSKFLWFLGGVPYIQPARVREYSQRGIVNRLFGQNNPRWWAVKNADGMVVYSKHAKDYYTSLGFSDDKIWVAPNAPDTERLLEYERSMANNPAALEKLQSHCAKNGELVILTLGRLNKGRQIDVLLKAFERLQKALSRVSLVIIGDGPERIHLEELAGQLELENVFFTGAIFDDEELAKYFLLSSIFVTPGVASLAVKMAMTFGKPVVTVDFGLEVHDVVDRYNGFIFTRGDVGRLADILLRLCRQPLLRRETGRNAKRTIVEDINIRNTIRGFQEAVDTVTTPA